MTAHSLAFGVDVDIDGMIASCELPMLSINTNNHPEGQLEVDYHHTTVSTHTDLAI